MPPGCDISSTRASSAPIVDQVGNDRRIETRIVEIERELVGVSRFDQGALSNRMSNVTKCKPGACTMGRANSLPRDLCRLHLFMLPGRESIGELAPEHSSRRSVGPYSLSRNQSRQAEARNVGGGAVGNRKDATDIDLAENIAVVA